MNNDIKTNLTGAFGVAWSDFKEVTDAKLFKPGKSVLADGLGLVSRLSNYAWMNAATGTWYNSLIRRLNDKVTKWQAALKASSMEPVKKTDLKGSVEFLRHEMARVIKKKFLFTVALFDNLFRGKPEPQKIPHQPLPLPPAHKIADLEMTLSLLEAQTNRGVEFNETLFQTSKTLYQLRRSLPKKWVAKDHALRVQLRTAEKRLEALNPHLPRVRDIAKANETLKETLAETVEGLCQKGQISPEDIDRDSTLFSLSAQEAKYLYAKRVVKAGRTGFHLSTVTGIERTWQEIRGKTEGITRSFDEGNIQRHVVFLPQEGDVYVKEEILPPGSFKVTSLATSFFDVKKRDQRGEIAILQPREDKPDKPTLKESIASGSMVVKEHVEQPRLNDVIDRFVAGENDKRDNEMLAFRREADFCKVLGRLPGVWPTHKVSTVDGDIAIFQRAAGYTLQRERAAVVDLSGIQRLLDTGMLSIPEQRRYLDMVNGALVGIQSLHVRGIIHRDLKLANLLVSKEGKGFVSDLGTVCQIEGDEEKKMAVGSPTYMAPEVGVLPQLSADSEAWRAIGTPADIWSLGVILWELGSGKQSEGHPSVQLSENRVDLLAEVDPTHFQDEEDRQQAQIIRKDYREQYQAGEPGSLAHFVWRCTRPNPSERPTIAEVRAYYQAWSQHVKERLDRGEVSKISDCFKDVVGAAV